MLRKILLVLASAAFAAAPVAAGDFSGGYVGVFAGSQSAEDVFHSDETEFITTVEPSGTVYGFMLGYNHQDENFVIGTEFEYGMSSVEEVLLATDPTNTFGYDISDEIGKTMRLRARFGYVLGDNWMPFLAAGVSSTTTTIAADAVNYIEVNRIGFGMGLGLDWQMTDTWSFRAEYYTEDFGSAVFNDYCNVCDTWDMNMSMDTARVSASMKF